MSTTASRVRAQPPLHACSLLCLALLLSPAPEPAAAGQAPFIAWQPASQVVRFGTNVNFQVQAGGEEPLSFRWRANGSNLYDSFNVYYGTGTTNLQLVSAHADNVGAYTVVVSNAYGSATSEVATLEIATQPGLLALHAGVTDPATEGWRSLGGGNSAVTGPTNDNGTLAWLISDRSFQ
jgi:hypothetical protein